MSFRRSFKHDMEEAWKSLLADLRGAGRALLGDVRSLPRILKERRWWKVAEAAQRAGVDRERLREEVAAWEDEITYLAREKTREEGRDYGRMSDEERAKLRGWAAERAYLVPGLTWKEREEFYRVREEARQKRELERKRDW